MPGIILLYFGPCWINPAKFLFGSVFSPCHVAYHRTVNSSFPQSDGNKFNLITSSFPLVISAGDLDCAWDVFWPLNQVWESPLIFEKHICSHLNGVLPQLTAVTYFSVDSISSSFTEYHSFRWPTISGTVFIWSL